MDWPLGVAKPLSLGQGWLQSLQIGKSLVIKLFIERKSIHIGNFNAERKKKILED
jgi:hypothetical protein